MTRISLFVCVAEVVERTADAVSLLMDEAVTSERQREMTVCMKLLHAFQQSESNSSKTTPCSD